MKKNIMIHFNAEILKAKSFISQSDFEKAFEHLERAHVLGQKYVFLHTQTHWYMLKVGWARRDFKEVLGQLVRLPLGIIGSFIGIIPIGNTGGSNVSAFKKMPIPKDLLELMKEE